MLSWRLGVLSKHRRQESYAFLAFWNFEQGQGSYSITCSSARRLVCVSAPQRHLLIMMQPRLLKGHGGENVVEARVGQPEQRQRQRLVSKLPSAHASVCYVPRVHPGNVG